MNTRRIVTTLTVLVGSVLVRGAETNTEAEPVTLRGHGDRLSAVVFRPDGKRVVSAGWDKTLKIWDATTGKEERTLTGHTDAVLGVAFSSDGRRIASGSWDHTVKVWDAARGRKNSP